MRPQPQNEATKPETSNSLRSFLHLPNRILGNAKNSNGEKVKSNGGDVKSNGGKAKKEAVLDLRDISTSDFHIPDGSPLDSETNRNHSVVIQKRRHRDFTMSLSFTAPPSNLGIETSPAGMSIEQLDKLECGLTE
mmetsp:Transcript_6246/g.8116  ORF Transcript_6246/g.8116 Transcript_6246/m.8116 type:complete len:135 (+) Transcript_6246:175-579(+)